MNIKNHRAKWVLVSQEKVMENGCVTVANGRITAIGRGGGTHLEGEVLDHGAGVIMPATINAHTHLELSLLKGRIPGKEDFLSWVKAIIHLKDCLTNKDIHQGLLSGANELYKYGAVLAGDHRSVSMQFPDTYWPVIIRFREYLRLEPAEILCDLNKDKYLSLAAHAPHTTAPELIKRMKDETKRHGRIFSVHLAESPEEAEFITTAKGKWAGLLNERGVKFSSWGLPAKSPVSYLDDIGVLDDKTLAVHLVQAGPGDLDLIAERGACVCLCPRSNNRLMEELPDIPAMLKRGIRPALGTDSLASVETLSLFDEMAFISESFPSLNSGDIISMATINGAKVLGMGEELGTLEPGKRAALLYLPVYTSSAGMLIRSLAAGSFKGLPEVIR